MLGESGAGKVLTEGPHSQIAKDPQRRGEDFEDRILGTGQDFGILGTGRMWMEARPAQRGGLDRGQVSCLHPDIRPFDLSRVCAPFRCAPLLLSDI